MKPHSKHIFTNKNKLLKLQSSPFKNPHNLLLTNNYILTPVLPGRIKFSAQIFEIVCADGENNGTRVEKYGT